MACQAALKPVDKFAVVLAIQHTNVIKQKHVYRSLHRGYACILRPTDTYTVRTSTYVSALMSSTELRNRGKSHQEVRTNEASFNLAIEQELNY